MMKQEQINNLLNELEQVPEYTKETINKLRKLLYLILEITEEKNSLNIDVELYKEAINILEKLISVNAEYHINVERLKEEYICACAESLNSSVSQLFISESDCEPKFENNNVFTNRKEVVNKNSMNPLPQIKAEKFEGIYVPDGKLCPGSSSIAVEQPSVELHKVEFSALAPKNLAKGEYSIINIVAYEKAYRHMVDEMIKTLECPTQETRSGIQKVAEGSEIKIILTSPDVEIEDNIETGIWQGEYLNFSFAIFLPEDYKKRQVMFVATVYINDIVSSKLKFIVKCSSLWKQKISISREDVLSAFVSYASQDRNRVATIIQGMKKVRPDMDIFFDVDCLRSGDDWEQALHQEIDKRDILFLCWSHFAKESKWVNAEWKYALDQKGTDFIEPVPIEPPDICPPPEELNQKHFNDKLLFIINAK